MRISILKYILIWVIVMILPDFAMASENSTAVEKLWEWLYTLVSFFSWAWMIFAIIAGKLMTNDFIYWTFMWLDVHLWKIWNMMKNFANYTVGFIFLFMLLKAFFSKEEPWAVFKQLLPKLLIAWVWIQASWFMIAVLVDLSLIMSVAAWSFPQQFIGGNPSSLQQMNKLANSLPSECTFNLDINIKDLWKSFEDCKKKEWESVDPNQINKFTAMLNNYSWPILFLWLSVMRFQDNMFLSKWVTDFKKITVTFMLHVILCLMFVIPIILLLVVNIIRLFWIWMYVIFSPFIVLDAVFGNKVLWSKNEAFKIWNMLWLIFQPVAIVFVLWVSLILVLWLSEILMWMWWASMTTDSSVWKAENIKNLKSFWFMDSCFNSWQWATSWDKRCGMETPSWKFYLSLKPNEIDKAMNYLWWWIGYLIMTMFTILLLWWLLKAWFSMSKITAHFTDWMFKFLEKSAMSVPLVPWTWLSIWAMQRAVRTFEDRTLWAMQAHSWSELSEKIMDSIWLWGAWWISPSDYRALKTDINANTEAYALMNAFFSRAREINKTKPLNLATMTDWKKSVQDWITKDISFSNSVFNNHYPELAKLAKDGNWDELFRNQGFAWMFDKMLEWNIVATNNSITNIRWVNAAPVYNKTYNPTNK